MAREIVARILRTTAYGCALSLAIGTPTAETIGSTSLVAPRTGYETEVSTEYEELIERETEMNAITEETESNISVDPVEPIPEQPANHQVSVPPQTATPQPLEAVAINEVESEFIPYRDPASDVLLEDETEEEEDEDEIGDPIAIELVNELEEGGSDLEASVDLISVETEEETSSEMVTEEQETAAEEPVSEPEPSPEAEVQTEAPQEQATETEPVTEVAPQSDSDAPAVEETPIEPSTEAVSEPAAESVPWDQAEVITDGTGDVKIDPDPDDGWSSAAVAVPETESVPEPVPETEASAPAPETAPTQETEPELHTGAREEAEPIFIEGPTEVVLEEAPEPDSEPAPAPEQDVATESEAVDN